MHDVRFPYSQHWIQSNDPKSMARPSKIETTGTMPLWSSGTYAYDGAGNVSAIGNDSYIYDKVSRVTSGTASGGDADADVHV